MKKAKEIDFKEMNELFYYDESSPSGLRWKVNRGKVRVGDIAGCTLTSSTTGWSCWQVKTSNKNYHAHRIIYLLQHGQLSTDLEIDHIDGNSLNNKIENLRAVSHNTNVRNQKKQRNNTTGVTGVNYDSHRNRYVARYHDPQGRTCYKSFSCFTHGTEMAFKLASQWRAEKIEELNKILGDERYTTRHGV